MSALSKVWVVSEAPERFAKLGAVGRRLGERVEAVAVGEGAAQAAAKMCIRDRPPSSTRSCSKMRRLA